MPAQSRRPRRPNDTTFLQKGMLASYVSGREVRWLRDLADDDSAARRVDEQVEVLIAYRLLQRAPDYRGAIQAWFGQVKIGGSLIVVVPHAFLYERQYSLPSRWDAAQRRLYTPASLLIEVEESLVPNSYRIRWLCDLDGDYDYRQHPESQPIGESDIALVLEHIDQPAWSLDEALPLRGTVQHHTADYAFEPGRTRFEVERRTNPKRIAILKLDHLGDLIMGTPALQRARSYFADAWIDLIVGSWNVGLARDLGVADRVIAFDAFPRNSTEEEVNVDATLGLFKAQVGDAYDLAIDLRADVDTRPLLRAVQARVKAGIGSRSRFPFLDIALPLDGTRNEAERVRDHQIELKRFALHEKGVKSPLGFYFDRHSAEPGTAIVWGPYIELDPGDYMFDFHLDLNVDQGGGLLRLDIALDYKNPIAEKFISGPGINCLSFRVDEPRSVFEARIFPVTGFTGMDFYFYGGRLIKKGPGNALHQAEYAALLVEFVKLRMLDFGDLEDHPEL